MSPKERKETLRFMRDVALCADRAADTSGRDREYAELRRCIRSQERDHRAMGRRMVGNIGPRLTVDQAVDYFVAKVLTEGARKYGCGASPIGKLAGIREDFVRGAILMSDKAFVATFFRNLDAMYLPSGLGVGREAIFERVTALDYCDLVQK